MADQSTARSKRQRLFELMKNTKDVYIPTIASTVTQLAAEATTKALNYADGDSTAREIGVNTDIKGAQILLYPHFTRHDSSDPRYFTQVHGWVFSTEGSSRKKRIIFSLARQLAKANTSAVTDMTAGQLDEQLSNMHDDDASTISSASSDPPSGGFKPLKRTGTASSTQSETSLGSTQSEADEVLRERIASFVNRSLGNTELEIAVGGKNRDELETVNLLTDANGNFNIDVATPFKPTYIQVAIAHDEKIFVFKDAIFPGLSKFGIISDIDDTIKHTGVCGDKRTVFRNTFTEHMETWEIAGAADCYRYFYQKYDMSFFYVSNSPYQLYSNLVKFFELFEFPPGSMYLKKYSGNILNSFFEPSHTRKKAPLERIMQHFSDKKFFLLGDTSEQDLEAYVDIARSHPDKVAAIYIRLADGSMTTETFKILNDIVNKRSIPLQETSNEMREKFEQLQTSEQNLIDLEDEPTPGISKEHMAKLVQESHHKSKKVNEGQEDLEQGSSDAFFTSSRGTSSESSTPITTKSKPPPPPIPTKPKILQSPTTIPSTASSSSSFSSSSSASESASELPRLPRRPIPPPPKSSLARARTDPTLGPPSFISNASTFNNEETEEWITRLLTALLILRKSGDIKLKLFVEFAEVQEDMEKYMKAHTSK